MNKRVVYDNYPELLEVGIPCFGHYENKSPYVKLIREHHNGCYEICFLESGMQPYFIYPDAEDENKQDLYRLYGGETFISYPYQYHSTGSFFQQRGNLYWIQLDSECPRLLNQTEENTNLLKNALATINRHIIRVPPSITARMIEAYRSVLDANKEHVFRMCSLLSVYILDLADFNRKIKSEVYRYGSLTSLGNEAVSFILDNLLNPGLDVEAVANHLNYSRSYTMTLFKKEIGMTIHEFILRSKIDYACDLLSSTPITEIALALHFSSSQHFSNVFKAYTGMTPSTYSDNIRKTRKGEVRQQ